ncbi:DUF4412 domain-containing protein [Acetobacter okinawensis]|uniref:DUF4412 domain-containing protein n=1 Tax=Acetobacter okinawensis TaxID=1076594 RepID=UPI00055095A4
MDLVTDKSLSACLRSLRVSGLCAAGVLGVSAITAAPSHAQLATDHPRLTPGRDAVIDYVFQPRPTEQDLQAGAKADTPVASRHVQVLYSGDGGLMRINYMTSMEGDQSRGAVIINRAAQEVLVIINDRHIYTRLVQQEGVRNPFLLDMSMQFTKTGSSVVAGQPCTTWRAVFAQGKAETCVTDDGFVLQQDGVDVDGLNGSLRATKVAYDIVPVSAFQPPAGFVEVTPHSPRPDAATQSQSQPSTTGVGPTATLPTGNTNPEGENR